MYNMYTDLDVGSVSYEYYRKIFNHNFNIKFGYPRSDTCSSCDKFNAEKLSLQRKLENTPMTDGKVELMQQLKNLEIQNELHLRKAEVFYARKRAARKRSMKVTDYESIAMDFQKNLPLPNITTNDVYYKRQLAFYSFNIHVLSTADSYFYCYSENIAAKGSDEVISMLHHFIFTQLDKKVKQLEIFCDSCGGQNKNFNIFRYIHYVVVTTRRLDKIKITFPIRGHSYLECDKNMGLINQNTKAETIADWINEITGARAKPTPFKVFDLEQSFFRQWNKYLAPYYVVKCPFAVQPVREIQAESVHPRYLTYRSSYNGALETAIVRNAFINQTEMPGPDEFFLPDKKYTESIPISLEKWENLQQLKTFCETDGASEFYGNLPHKLTRKAKKNPNVLHTVIESDSEKDEEKE
ncbi:uncharacterized protein [Diabrotica undecimpunctata]|uniref:uncharacterized protein n=1 Tax=Diabrotica undecimpunctata TaxID=50387 RepID=UPI003B63DFED